MKRAAVAPHGSARARFILSLAALLLGLSPLEVANALEGLTDPFLWQPDAIAAGRDIYRSKCLVCHQSAGARGPNIFKTKLSDEQFLATVINGRKRTQMPAFGLRLSIDEVWQVHSLRKSTGTDDSHARPAGLARDGANYSFARFGIGPMGILQIHEQRLLSG